MKLASPDRSPEAAASDRTAWIQAVQPVLDRLLADPRLLTPATLMARLQPGFIDYIAQAPVLVVALAGERTFVSRKERRALETEFLLACRDRPKLNALLRRCGLSPALRHIAGPALRAGQRGLLATLTTLKPSALAQAIPAGIDAQRSWLERLALWIGRRRHDAGTDDPLFRWAAVHFGGAAGAATTRDVEDICDFVGDPTIRFDVRWTLCQAKAASDAWHAAAARRARARYRMERAAWPGLAASLRHADAGPARDMPRRPFDLAVLDLERFDLAAHTFVALQTTEQLIEEGAAMHNCVHTYGDHVARGRSLLFSLREKDRRIATLELLNVADGATRRYLIGQLRSPCNGLPSPEAILAANACVARVNATFERVRREADDRDRLAAARQAILRLCQARGT